MPGPLVLLGPQRPTPNLPAVLDTLPNRGHVVVITAGWRYDEADDEALRADIGPDTISLPLYDWFERVATEAPVLAQAYRQRQRQILQLKGLYRTRLHPALEVTRTLFSQKSERPELVEPELAHALETIRELDDRFVARSDAFQAAFKQTHEPRHHPLVHKMRAKAAELLSEARAVVIAGGHVGVLRNRLEFFELGGMLAEINKKGSPIVAWSAGAMVLSDRPVLFYDDPPDGRGEAEVLDRGMGLAPEIVVLPHARQRLRLDDPDRVSSLAGRFDPVPCIGMDNGAWLQRTDDTWQSHGTPGSALLLSKDGSVSELEAVDA